MNNKKDHSVDPLRINFEEEAHLYVYESDLNIDGGCIAE